MNIDNFKKDGKQNTYFVNSNKSQCVLYVKSHWQFSKSITFGAISKQSISIMETQTWYSGCKKSKIKIQASTTAKNVYSPQKMVRPCKPFTEVEFI